MSHDRHKYLTREHPEQDDIVKRASETLTPRLFMPLQVAVRLDAWKVQYPPDTYT